MGDAGVTGSGRSGVTTRPEPGTRGERACRRLDDGTAIYIVGDQTAALRLDLFLKERIPKLSRRRIQEAIRSRVVVPGHARSRPAMLVRPGDTVIVKRDEPPDEAEPEITVPILHLDEDLIVIDKPAGLLAHPSRHVRKGSVSHILARQVAGPCHLAHRLDRETSGLMLVARSSWAARLLSDQLARATAGAVKSYRAVVYGEMATPEGAIDLPIGKAVRSAVYVKRGVNHDDGRASRTRYRVEATAGGFTLVRLWLLTGRRHQIRVHMAAIGHAVVGDKLYGPTESHYLRFIRGGFDERMRRELLTTRQMLHASDLSFLHPRDGATLRFSSPLPDDMREFLLGAGFEPCTPGLEPGGAGVGPATIG